MGLGYHPFHHAALIGRVQAFDFVELPLDLYLDPARSALFDPMDARLRDIATARPCVWHGSALSLGSVERPGDPAQDPFVIDRIRELMRRTDAVHYTDVIGFRRLDGRDLGVPIALPPTETAARWMAARCGAARDALGHALLLRPAGSRIDPACPAGEHTEFWRRVVALTGCELSLDVADLERIWDGTGDDPDAMIGHLPLERVAMLACAGANEAEWTLLARLTAATPARAIVIRRSRDLYPLDTIVPAADRARSLLARSRCPVAGDPMRNPAPARSPEDDPNGLAALRSHEARMIDRCLGAAPPHTTGDIEPTAETTLATDSRPWQVWRERIGEIHKARQIAAFLAEDMASKGWPHSGQRG